jgi:hypothetical protein
MYNYTVLQLYIILLLSEQNKGENLLDLPGRVVAVRFCAEQPWAGIHWALTGLLRAKVGLDVA